MRMPTEETIGTHHDQFGSEDLADIVLVELVKNHADGQFLLDEDVTDCSHMVDVPSLGDLGDRQPLNIGVRF